MRHREQGAAVKRSSTYHDIAASAAGPLLAFVVTLTQIGGGEDISAGVTTPLLFAAVAIGAGFGGRWSALSTAALSALGLLLGKNENDTIAAGLAVAVLVAIALVTGELRDRAERAERAAGVADERLKRVALRDALTGLLDRRGFEFATGVEIAREARRGGTFALLLLDLSGLRATNDQFGRSVGDTLIQILADAIEQRIRQSDIPARIADHQFAVILPDTSSPGAEVIARQIFSRFNDDLFGVVPSGLVSGGSFAVSVFPVDGVDLDALLTIAGRRLAETSSDGTGARNV